MQSNSRRDIVYPIGLALALALGVVLGVGLQKDSVRQSLTVSPRTDKLSTVLQYIEDQYVDTVSMSELIELAIPSLLSQLDPHSVYLPADEQREATETLEGGFEGIGISFNVSNDTVVIINTIVGGPSERIGLLAGDRIITINDSLVAGVGIPQHSIVRKLKGPQGTRVRVGVMRRGVDEPIVFEIVRDKIPLHSVDIAYMLTPNVGYIKISRFARTTHREFVEAAQRLIAQGMTQAIIDLRGNHGGYLDAATSIANEFLPEGKLIVYTQGKSRARQNVFSNARGIAIGMPVAVLIDEFSASASEILAGALQDNDRGLVVGRRSFGKGLVQDQVLFSDGSALRLTIARYYTPTGRSIQKPFDPGGDQYHDDLLNRYMRGEFKDLDSIHLDKSLRFVTPGGRVVFGGGGIMPDFFIPLDTAGITPYFNQVASRNLIYRFAFTYTDSNRDKLRRLRTPQEFQSRLSRRQLVEQFVAFAEQNGVPANPEEIERSREILGVHILASIARNILDNQGYYPIIRQIDHTLSQALEILEQNKPSPLIAQPPAG